jgi:V/A-type H+/Na+-transporting ATPase subunit D
MAQEQPNPTRMELMRVEERIRFANKGYQLLKQKRDILLIELMTLIHTSMTLRDSLNLQLAKSYSSLRQAQSYHGAAGLRSLAMAVPKTQDTSVGIRNAMGVRLPMISRIQEHRRIPDRGYGLASSSSKVDETAENFEKSLELILELAEKEVSMKKLLQEIEKTKRRVNSLDYIVLPWLADSRSEINLHLAEMEKDELITLKSVKRHLETASSGLNRA